jgi:hypothetical protein
LDVCFHFEKERVERCRVYHRFMCCVKVVRRGSEEDLVFVVLPKNPKEK